MSSPVPYSSPAGHPEESAAADDACPAWREASLCVFLPGGILSPAHTAAFDLRARIYFPLTNLENDLDSEAAIKTNRV